MCQKCSKCAPKVIPNRDLSERCTTSFRPPCTVWKALLPLHLSYKITSEIDGISKHSPNHSRSIQSIPKVSHRGPDGSKYDPKWPPKTSQNSKKIGLAPPRPPAPSKSCHWPPQMLPNGAHNVPESLQMSSKIVQNGSATAVLERRRAEENKSRRVSFDICRSLVANHRIIHSSSSGEVGGRGGSL